MSPSTYQMQKKILMTHDSILTESVTLASLQTLSDAKKYKKFYDYESILNEGVALNLLLPLSDTKKKFS